MELQFMTPTEVWEGFNPVKDPLETSITSSEEKDNIVRRGLFFTSENTDGGKIRVFAELFFDKRWKDDRPAVLIVPSLSLEADYTSLIHIMLKEGYAAALVDFAGTFSDGAVRTTYPANLSYSTYPECRQHMYGIETSARNTPWFQWAKVVRRTLSLLQENHPVDPTRIAVLGIGTGAQIAWQVAGMDARVTALVAVDGGGYLWRQGAPRFTTDNIPSTDAERAFSTGVGAETYARLITRPVCYVVPSNSNSTDVDRAGDIISLIPSESKALMISRGTNEQINKCTFDSLVSWMHDNFAHDATPIPVPSLAFEQIEGHLYLRLKTEKMSKETTVNVSYGEPHPFSRYWTTLPAGQKVGKHEYTFNVPITYPDEIVVAFATVKITSGITVSTPVICTVPSKLGATNVVDDADAPSRLIYNNTMGIGAFSAASRDIVLDEQSVCVATGPFGINGVSVKNGELTLYRSAHDIYCSKRDAVLKFDAYSAEPRVITLKLLAYPDLKYYSTQIKLTGGEFWQKVALSAADFKSTEGKTLALFSDGKKYVFSGAENVVFNNLLWI